MKVFLISYASTEFRQSQKLLNSSALANGVDQVISFSRKDIIGTEFYRSNKKILDMKKGSGYWLWKPYLILETLKKMDDEDVLIYCDSAVEVVGNVRPLVEICKKNKGIMLFRNYYKNTNRKFTKRDCFVLMGADRQRYWDSMQITASYQLYMNTKENRDLISEWLEYCQDPRILTDIPNECGLEDFSILFAHRHDQSILSILAEKYHIELFRDPSQFGNEFKMPQYRVEGEELHHKQQYLEQMLNSPYGTVFNHHRRKELSNPLKRFARRILGAVGINIRFPWKKVEPDIWREKNIEDYL